MRNPERIDRITEKLRLAWHRWPQWRLGQLVSNLLGTGPQDVFFVEDREWEELLNEVIAERPSETEPDNGE